jgi:integrase/recombinase XerC
VAIVQVFLHCSLRVGEIVALDVDHVDLDRHLLIDIRVKGGKRLSVPFNDVVAEALEKYLHARDAAVGEKALFVSNRKKRMTIRAVQELVKSYGKRAGITRRITPHILRHSSASELAEMGTPLSAIQSHLGHASPLTTARYIHVNGNAVKHAVNELGARWKKRTRTAAKAAKRTIDTSERG